jgi:hypothetical protein
MNDLPIEILENIFKFCNFNTILNLSNTCKLFRLIVTDKNFKITIRNFYEFKKYLKNCAKNKTNFDNLIITSKNLWIPKLPSCLDKKIHYFYLNTRLSNYQQLILLKHIHKMPGNIMKLYYKKLHHTLKYNKYIYFSENIIDKAILNLEFDNYYYIDFVNENTTEDIINN